MEANWSTHYLQYRLPKCIGRWREQTTDVNGKKGLTKVFQLVQIFRVNMDTITV